MKTHFFANPPKQKADPKQLTNLEALKKTPVPCKRHTPPMKATACNHCWRKVSALHGCLVKKKITYMCIIIHHIYIYIWVFPTIAVPQNGWFIMESPIKMDDLGGKPTIFGNIHISWPTYQAPARRLRRRPPPRQCPQPLHEPQGISNKTCMLEKWVGNFSGTPKLGLFILD